MKMLPILKKTGKIFENSYDEWSSENFEKMWNEMREIESLTQKK